MLRVRENAQQLLDNQVADAWFEYLERTRGQGARYNEIELWAWAQLRSRLKSIKARRKKLAA